MLLNLPDLRIGVIDMTLSRNLVDPIMSIELNRDEVIAAFRAKLGNRHVIIDNHRTKPYRTGYRGDQGQCLAVLRPGSLVELWHSLQLAVRYDLNIVIQAANTGLTGGSTPRQSYDNPAIIINMNRLRGIKPVGNGSQVICFPGSTLSELERLLRPLGREPHSVIGSSCLGASVIGGVCNNSGGALVERGPAYTEQAIYARLDASGKLHLENELGIDLGRGPEEILSNLEQGSFFDVSALDSLGVASDREYEQWVRDIEASSPARYNADPRRLHGASGCAGKLAVFAVRLDTFPKNVSEKTFFVGTNDANVLTDLRREILSSFDQLPVSAEYVGKDTFRFTELYGRDTIYLVRAIGTDRLPKMFKAKETLASRLDAVPFLSGSLIEHALQRLGQLLPNPVPKKIRQISGRCHHLLILKMKEDSIQSTADYLSGKAAIGELEVHNCSEREAEIVGLHRFAVAGAAMRYKAIREAKVGELLALDIALPRNTKQWHENLPDELDEQIERKLYYGHFMCQVFHQDYILKSGTDALAIKAKMLDGLEARGAKYPAEHNVGHQYHAETELCEHYRSLDPRNQLNPGIGKDSLKRNYT
jgi:D-lactate dehydrogenase (quinone)